ncbi:MAG: Uma2 family endonuclease [Sulfurisoma sp.]|nr:Uma2 family endonuclease [Sulfurisoma sp.]
MNLPQRKPEFGPDDYLAWENAHEERHEYIDGEVFDMVGVSVPHNLINGNIYMALRNHLRGNACQVFAIDLKLRVEEANCFFYPDLFVSCATPGEKPDSEYFRRHAKLVVEVLSESTAGYDRGRKFAYYRQLPSLKEYVLVDQERQSVELFRRDATDHWVLHPFGPDETVEFASVGLSLPIAAIYEDVGFPE